ncbi:hypothetical protein Bca52824_056922 [Brassica carinata]|uniref:No apical meristem-associated C-terminal domain-containing protein n=1 Tax=Brassica carinata TaxID=52824 RepID=A0A8X7UD70_BRACI|nr:hypothetical protein Bca52824_056922 [Brassica carinata]
MDPYTQQCSFQNLLNIQTPNTQWNESVSASVPREPYQTVSVSDASVFSSQWNEDRNEDVEISKRRKLVVDPLPTSVPGEDDNSARPAGVKAAKAKAKKPVRKTTLEEEGKEFHNLWEIRQHDFALKDKLNKQKLLESLIVKTEPLTELELALKDQLIKDMLA